MAHCCVSCGYKWKFIEQERISVNLPNHKRKSEETMWVVEILYTTSLLFSFLFLKKVHRKTMDIWQSIERVLLHTKSFVFHLFKMDYLNNSNTFLGQLLRSFLLNSKLLNWNIYYNPRMFGKFTISALTSLILYYWIRPTCRPGSYIKENFWSRGKTK